MKLTITLDVECPPWLRKVLWVAGPAILLAGVQAAYADVPHAFEDNQVLTAAQLNGNFIALDTTLADVDGKVADVDDKVADVEQRVAALEAPAPEPACPRGYAHDTTVTAFTVCKKGDDQVVKVGQGGAAYWIDRYEASVWDTPAASGTQYFEDSNDFPGTFQGNGQWSGPTPPAYAVSKAGVSPARFVTWFQAREACAASGKRLPLVQEWIGAARGTPDPGSASGTAGECVTQAASPRAAGGATTCVSSSGVEDMIGNVSELTSEWSASPAHAAGEVASAFPWPGNYSGDATVGITSVGQLGAGYSVGLPAVYTLGGHYLASTGSGIFAIELSISPAAAGAVQGFRCVVPR
jgi:formylglycine-generating enzyme required for sulfatase activity